MNKQFVTFASIGVAALLSGCASQSVKNASAAVSKSEFVYGAVFEKHDFDTDKNRSFCATNTKPDWAQVCANIKSYEEAHIAILHHSRLVSGWVAVPKSWEVKSESVLRVRPAAAIATELSAVTPRPGCSWTGNSLDNLVGRSGMVKGFVAGMLIVPGVVMLADDSITEEAWNATGGVTSRC
jgi:hypothetical protein